MRRRLIRPALAAAALAVAAAGCREAPEPAAREPAPPATVVPAAVPEPLLPPGSPFHGVHGLRFGPDGALYAASVIGQSIFRVDLGSGALERVVAPPEGMADDIAFAPDGTMVWTAIEDGVVYARSPGGPVRRLVDGMRGVNAVSFSPDGRLFVTLVFYGDALYELDLAGSLAPRLVAENLGGLNAFDIGDDGMIYGPLLFGGRVVRVDPDSGAIATLSDEFERPGALKLDRSGNAYVLDGAALKRVALASGATSVVAELPFEADNLAFDPDGRLYVSMAQPNAIAEVDLGDGSLRYVAGPTPLNSPSGLAALEQPNGDVLYVGDLFGGLRIVASPFGTVTETPVELFQPTHVSLRGERVLVTSEVFGVVQRLDRATYDVLEEWDGFERPADAIETPDGEVIVAETGTGRVLAIGPDGTRRVVAMGLDRPTGLAWAGSARVYVTESGGGRLLALTLATGETVIEAADLAQPEGVAVARSGEVYVVEVGARRIRRLAPRDGTVATVAEDLPIGLANGPSLFRGIALGGSTLYFSSDVDNTLYRLALQ